VTVNASRIKGDEIVMKTQGVRRSVLSWVVGVLCVAVAALATGCAGTATQSAGSAPQLARMSKPSDAAALTARCDADLQGVQARLSGLLDAAKAGPVAPMQVINDYHAIEIYLRDALAIASLFQNVHPDQAVREASATCEQQASKLATDLSLNTDLYKLFADLDPSGLDPLTQRLVTKTMEDFKRAGVDKDEATRDQIKALQEELVGYLQTFTRSIREDSRSVSLDPSQLDGMPEDFIKAHPPGADGKVVITTDYPDLIPFMRYAKDGEARRLLSNAQNNRAYPGNIEVLQNILTRRHALAVLLGYKNWADHITSDKMIGSGDAVAKFLDQVSALATPRSNRDLAQLLAAKRVDDPNATAIEVWDKNYYEGRVKQAEFSFDPLEARAYFPYARVKQGLLDLTAELFSVRYVAVPDAEVWHEDVEVFDVFDARDDRPLGRIYLDMFPRENKYDHAAQFTLRDGVAGVQLPEGVLVCNFPKPSGDDPGLMDHSEVSTFFHEFGHLMHHTLGGHQPWVRFSGVATEWDFVEAPSQLFEEWALDADVLRRFALHHETQAPIPAELVAKLRAADEFGQGVDTRRQMFYAALSLYLHNRDPKDLDTTAEMIRLHNAFHPLPYAPDTHTQASFGHLEGYSAIYYTYMWSLVIAKDIVSAFKDKGFLDHEVAMRYREKILEPGGIKPAADLVSDFLGRPYSFEAFRVWLEGK
jgi:thimet oligopeptidase